MLKIVQLVILHPRFLNKRAVYKPNSSHPALINLLLLTLQRVVRGICSPSVICREDKDRVIIEPGRLESIHDLPNPTVQGLESSNNMES